MKIAYVYEYDASDPAVQSTRPFSIWQELKRRFDVVNFFPIPNISRRLLIPKKILHKAMGKDHHLEREWLSLKEYVWRIGSFVRQEKPDVIFSPSQLIATYLETTAKLVYCNDAPFGGIVNYYPNFSNLSDEYVRLGYRQEYLSHKNADRIVYPSAWARECAIRLHDADPEKCLEQPFGANLPYELTWPEVRDALDRRAGRKSISLLMISSDWERKGGPFALEVTRELVRRGIQVQLTVIGAAPHGMDGVKALGRIDKWTDAGAEKFKAALFDSDFMIMPSLAEAYGMALWEGAAHGLPMIGRATGGISSIIRDRESGLLFPYDAEPALIADWIEQTLASGDYRRLSEQAFADYRTRGNWTSFVDKVFEL
jgi:glycosyltransferase involved in cell wall biosynthesis